MKRFFAFPSALLLSAVICAGMAMAQSANNTKSGWFPRAKYGLEDTYTFGGLPGDGGYSETIDSAGNLPPNLDSLANGFNAVQYANDCAAFGLDYLEFSAWHCNMNLLYPSPVMDRWRGTGHASRRDVIRDLINALKPKGIKLLLYVHPADGHDMSAADQAALGWSNTADPTRWMTFQCEIFEELCSRYTTDIDGFFFDGLWAHHNPEIGGWVDPAPIGAIIHQYNPNAVVINNNTGVNAACEYNTDERYPGSTDIRTYNCTTDQVQLLLGDQWWSTHPYTVNVIKFSAENILRWTIFQGGCSRSGGMCWADGSYWKGGWQGGIKSTLTKVGTYLSPISESIRNTYPSTSFVLPSGTLYSAMPNGIVALQSPDKQTEYIHVLKPPTGSTLNLPVPADGKVFTSASILRPSGLSVTLSQNTSGVHLTISGAWDSVNTVIKLAVDPASIKINAALNKPVTASSEANGWAASNAVDGGATGWSSSNSEWVNHTEWIIVNLDSVYRVIEVDLYPRNDAPNTGYGFPIDFTIQLSTDSLNWTTVVTRTGYPLPGSGAVQVFPFSVQNAKYVKIQGTSLRPNPNDGNRYRMQFAEIEVIPAQETSIVPSRKHGVSASLLQDRSYRNVTGRLTLDPALAGRTKTVAVYDLGGHLLKQKQAAGEVIDLRKDFGIAAGVYLVQVTMVR